jgi:hypothetical protein
VVKFSYLEPVAYRDSLLKALGWRSADFQLLTPAAGMAHSYHCEITAPQDLEIIRTELFAISATGKREKVEEVGRNACRQRTHLHLVEVTSNTNAVLRTRLRASRRGMPTTAAMLAVAVSLLLTAGVLFRGRIAESSESTNALLVAIPALLAAYLIRPGEHQLSRRLLFGIRWLTAAIGLLSFLAAASLAISHNDERRILETWLPIAGLAWLLTFGLLLSAILPRPSSQPSKRDFGED